MVDITNIFLMVKGKVGYMYISLQIPPLISEDSHYVLSVTLSVVSDYKVSTICSVLTLLF